MSEVELKIGNRYIITNDTEWEGTVLHFIGCSKNTGYHGYFEYDRGYFHLNLPHYACAIIPNSKTLTDYEAEEAENYKIGWEKDNGKLAKLEQPKCSACAEKINALELEIKFLEGNVKRAKCLECKAEFMAKYVLNRALTCSNLNGHAATLEAEKSWNLIQEVCK